MHQCPVLKIRVLGPYSFQKYRLQKSDKKTYTITIAFSGRGELVSSNSLPAVKARE